jgi:predicted O-linked N-acetylglucosamine transferase (SPINDLY family)
MDYRLIDNITDPVDQADNLSSERLIRLPKGFLCYRGNDSLPEPQSPPFTKNQYFTFGSFNNLAKVNEDVITSWSRILLRVPNSKLLIKSKHLLIDSVRNRYLKLFEDAGVAIERIDLRTEIKDQDEHMKLYNEVDLALDPFPYNGTTTTCEALWMGVPTVTFTGDRHASRVGASIMSHAGLSEFVATDIDSYIELASQVATYPDKLTHLRKNLRNQMKKSDLCNTKQFAELIEEQYRKLALD